MIRYWFRGRLQSPKLKFYLWRYLDAVVFGAGFFTAFKTLEALVKVVFGE